MALINCIECEKEISEYANTCPHCGYPIKSELIKTDAFGEAKPHAELVEADVFLETKAYKVSSFINNTPPQCPKCYSTQVVAQNEGLGLGKAAVGNMQLGPVGFGITSKKTKVICLSCRKVWKFNPKRKIFTEEEKGEENARYNIINFILIAVIVLVIITTFFLVSMDISRKAKKELFTSIKTEPRRSNTVVKLSLSRLLVPNNIKDYS